MKLEDHPTVKKYRTAEKPPSAPERVDSAWLREVVLEAGADDVGFVEVDREALADQKADILRTFPATRTLISYVCRYNRPHLHSVDRSLADIEFVDTAKTMNAVARRVMRALEEKGIASVSPAAGFPMEMSRWPGKMWAVSHKPVAVAAGLGRMGHHRVLIHPVFGDSICLGTMLVDTAVSEVDRPLDYNPCIECKLCVAVCPVGAIQPDGAFQFSTCLTHCYRNRLGGFSDWIETVIVSGDRTAYRRRFDDAETMSIWQSLTYGGGYLCSYCLSVCPAGEEAIGPYLDDRKGYLASVVKPLQNREETVYVIPKSDAEIYTPKRFPGKTVKRVGNGLRAPTARAFADNLGLLFQRGKAEGIDATYHFRFHGEETFEGTVTIRNRTVAFEPGLHGEADCTLRCDSETWVKVLAREQNILTALVRGKVKVKGSLNLVKRFAACFPS